MTATGERITVVLPVDASDAAVAVGATATLAAGTDGFSGRTLGVVDNGLWRSMATVVAHLEREWRARGVVAVERTPFDHLAPDFAAQQEGLFPFGERVAGAVAGLGN